MFYLQISVVVAVALICFFFIIYFFLYFLIAFCATYAERFTTAKAQFKLSRRQRRNDKRTNETTRTAHEHKPKLHEWAQRTQGSSCAAAVAVVVAYITVVVPAPSLLSFRTTHFAWRHAAHEPLKCVHITAKENTGWLWFGWKGCPVYSFLAIKFKCATSDVHNNNNNVNCVRGCGHTNWC